MFGRVILRSVVGRHTVLRMNAHRGLLLGGAHDGERVTSHSAPYPDGMILLMTDDGGAYVVAGDHVDPETGLNVLVFRHDPDGSRWRIFTARRADHRLR